MLAESSAAGSLERRGRRRPRGAPNEFHLPSRLAKYPSAFQTEAIAKHILKYLELNDLLNCRLVCQSWNGVICRKDSATHSPALLWKEGCLFYESPSGEVENRYKGKSMVLAGHFHNFITNSLVTRLHCPAYHFRFLDCRFSIVDAFFAESGAYIESLRLDNCILSLISFQRIILACPNLELLEVNGMFHCFQHAEYMFPSKSQKRLSEFQHLRKLCFQSTYVTRLLKLKYQSQNSSLGSKSLQHSYREPEIQNLNARLIGQILNSAIQLEKLSLSGFGINTVSDTLQILAVNPVHKQMKELVFSDIPDTGGPTSLCDLNNLCHMKLKKFVLAFLWNSRANIQLGLENSKNLLDEPIRHFLFHHQHTLEELELKNCEVTDAIFYPPGSYRLPHLTRLDLAGTQVGSTDVWGKSQTMREEIMRDVLTNADLKAKLTIDMTQSGVWSSGTIFLLFLIYAGLMIAFVSYTLGDGGGGALAQQTSKESSSFYSILQPPPLSYNGASGVKARI